MLQSYRVMTSGPVEAIFQQQRVSSTETFISPNLWQRSIGRVRRTQSFSKFITYRIGLYYHWRMVQRNRPDKHCKFFILPIIIIFCYIAHRRVHNCIVLSQIICWLYCCRGACSSSLQTTLVCQREFQYQ
jgi:hypothetical protein